MQISIITISLSEESSYEHLVERLQMWPASSPLKLRDKTEPEIKPRVTALNLTENTLQQSRFACLSYF